MAELLVRDIDPSLVGKLEDRASEHGVSSEEEHRRILENALTPDENGKPSLMEFLLSSEGEVHPDAKLELLRNQEIEHRDTGF